jgi:hypothetical protein
MNDKLQILESVLGSGEKTNRDYYQFHCPFCSHRKKKLGISLGTGKWKCWVCPAKGSNVSILFRKLNQSQSKVQQVKELWKEKVYFKTEPLTTLQLPKEFKPLWEPSGSFFYKKAQGYVKKRGITEGDIIKHHIGYCEQGQYNDKVIFPSYTEQGQLNFFGSRTFNELSNYKFKIPENIDKNEIVFDENLINWQEPVILVESKLDAIVIKRNAYPLYGKGINKALQQKVLEEGTSEIIFCLDGDALNDAILQAEWFLNNGITVKKVRLPENEDPNSLGYKEVWKYIKKAEPLNESEIWLFKIKNKLK